MTLRPATIEELAANLADADARRQKVHRVDLRALNRILEYTPEDMTVSVETGITLAQLQQGLRAHGQWLPIDPMQEADLNIAQILAADLCGPRRFGYGTLREHLLGLRAVLADGRVIRNGGKVVKNVAGYDLCKLFVGAQDSLGIVVEATFKVRPLPETEALLAHRCGSAEEAAAILDRIFASALSPVILDWHNVNTTSHSIVVSGFAGQREDVQWQREIAVSLGLEHSTTLEYERAFWAEGASAVRRLAVLPSRVPDAMIALRGKTFAARAGNGTIYYRGGEPPPPVDLPIGLSRRIKGAYDPNHILPEMPL